MKVYEGWGPSGRMETTAVSLGKAESNLRYRLRAECGLSRFDAARYDLSPLREVIERQENRGTCHPGEGTGPAADAAQPPA